MIFQYNFIQISKKIKSKVDILILSSVLHYLEDTKFLFKFINRINPEIIIIDRTPFNFKKKIIGGFNTRKVITKYL